MKPPPTTNPESSPHDARIDAALGHYARAVPSPGLETRVSARVSVALRQTHRSEISSRLLLLRRLSFGALAGAAACGIIVGTIQHSNHILPPQAGNRSGARGGISAAGASHIPTQPTQEMPSINPEAPRTPPHSRATVSPGRHTTGAATPRSPYPPAQQPEASPENDPR